LGVSVLLYFACSVGPIDYTNMACDNGTCPAPWQCVRGVCLDQPLQGAQTDASGPETMDAFAPDSTEAVDALAPDSKAVDALAPDSAVDSGAAEAAPSSDARLDAPILSYRSQVMADSPVLYLRFGEDAGPTAIDETGHYNGTYGDAGVQYGAVGAIAGDPNTAVTLNGQTNAGVFMPPCCDFAGTVPMTMELWVKQTAPAGFAWAVYHGFVSTGGWDLIYQGTGISDAAGPKFERWLDSGTTGGSVVSSPIALTDSHYHHVVVTCDGVQLVLYIDGVLVGANATVSALPALGVEWFVGNQWGRAQGIIGSIDEFAVYDHALDAATVASHFAAAQ
jgi:hypothetical protein